MSFALLFYVHSARQEQSLEDSLLKVYKQETPHCHGLTPWSGTVPRWKAESYNCLETVHARILVTVS